MTEYWVSQGNKWCDFCKIFISGNPSIIRNHELGQRHKDSVAQKLNSMRKDKAAKEKNEKEAVRAVERIEAKAKLSYQKDVAAFQETRDAKMQALDAGEDDSEAAKVFAATKDWDYDSSSGYYYNPATSCYYDPNSGFYYSDTIGRWVTQKEAFAKLLESSDSIPRQSILRNKTLESTGTVGPLPGPVVPSASLNPMRAVKSISSSVRVVKRKMPDMKSNVLSQEEKDALKAREAAKKRIEAREKNLLGLYQSQR